MREIKFRGKRLDTQEWEYGYIYQLPLPNGIGCMILTTDNYHEDNSIEPEYHLAFTLWVDLFPVKPDTIGQFTGLTDIDGCEIYDGDIVECVSWNEYFSKDGQPMEAFRRKMYVDFRNGGFKMVEPMPEPMKDNEWDIIYNGDIEVIGNIFDNPELLEKE